jgi:hypothetical protein
MDELADKISRVNLRLDRDDLTPDQRTVNEELLRKYVEQYKMEQIAQGIRTTNIELARDNLAQDRRNELQNQRRMYVGQYNDMLESKRRGTSRAR